MIICPSETMTRHCRTISTWVTPAQANYSNSVEQSVWMCVDVYNSFYSPPGQVALAKCIWETKFKEQLGLTVARMYPQVSYFSYLSGCWKILNQVSKVSLFCKGLFSFSCFSIVLFRQHRVIFRYNGLPFSASQVGSQLLRKRDDLLLLPLVI